jgi:RHS repeat-associated protein
LGRHAVSTLWVEYKNSGTLAMPAPLLVLKSADADNSDKPILSLDASRIAQNLWTATMPTGTSHSVQFFAEGNGDSPRVLEPGETGRVQVHYIGLLQPWNFSDTKVEFEIRVIDAENAETLTWDSREAWDEVFPNFSSLIGNTWGDYLNQVAETQGFLSRHVTGFDEKPQPDIDALFDYIANHATNTEPIQTLSADLDISIDAPGISLSFERAFPVTQPDRLFSGWLGIGWQHNWVKRLIKLDNGDVLLLANGTVYTYQPDSRGGYISPAGDFNTTLEQSSNRFVLRHRNGSQEVYNTNGWVSSLTDPNGNTITATYNGEKLIKLQHSAGQSLSFQYNDDHLIQIQDHTGLRRVSYAYDGAGRLASVTNTAGVTTAFTYIASNLTTGPLATVTHADGRIESFSYDEHGRLLTLALNGEETAQLDYSEIGKVKLNLAGDGSSGELYYGLNGNQVKQKDTFGNIAQSQFNANGQLTRVVRSDGLAGYIEYDQRGNPFKVFDPEGKLTRFTFDAGRRMTSITDARGHISKYAYDAAGNLERITFPDESYESANFDTQGNRVIATNRRGQAIDYTYNVNGQVTQKHYADNSSVNYEYDTAGNLVKMTDATGVTQFVYNANHLLQRVTYPSGRFLEFTYDAAGRRTSSLDQLKHRLHYSYDTRARLDRITRQNGTELEEDLVEYVYDAKDRLVRKTLGNSAYTTYEYDLANQLIRLTNYAPDDGVISFFAYTYDTLGRRIGMQTIDGQWIYGYDVTGQLISAVFTSGNSKIPSRNIAYTYDAAGNRLTEIVDGVTTEYVTNEMNQYTQVGDAIYTYDADGNLASKTEGELVWNYEFDSDNQLIRVSGAEGTSEFEYDGLGNLVAVVKDGARMEYLIDPAGYGDLVSEYDATGSLQKRYEYGNGLLSQNGEFFTFDGNGNTAELLAQDGEKLNHYVYEPFGTPLYRAETNKTDFQFVGEVGIQQKYDDLAFMRNRFYDVRTGKFISEDPIELVGLDSNLYRYVLNAPLNNNDPTGLSLRSVINHVESSENYIRGTYGDIKDITNNDCWANEAKSSGQRAADILKSDPLNYPGGIDAYMKDYHKLRLKATLQAQGAGFSVVGRSIGAGLINLMPDGLLQDILHRLVMPNSNCSSTPPSHNPNSYCGSGYNIGDLCKDNGKPDPSFKGTSGEIGNTGTSASMDPNQLTGPKGVSDSNYLVADTSLAYRIDFENDAKATAPAQIVEITNPLGDTLDWSSVHLTEIGFGDRNITVPANNAQAFQTRVPMNYQGIDFEVEIRAGIDTAAGKVYARFYSYLPDSELPPPVEIGFLPPEDGSGRGLGYVGYTVNHAKGVADNTEIRNVARIVFDFGEVIYTNQINPHDPSQGTDPTKEALVTIDALVAHSTIHALPTQSPAQFTVTWTGSDSASGVGSYDVFVRDGENQPWRLWLDDTTANQATFLGAAGKTYQFYSLATDRVGQQEQKQPSAEAATQIGADYGGTAGHQTTCALDYNGVTCWGNHSSNQTVVPELNAPIQVTVGNEHICALDADGVHCWGANAQGQTDVPVLVNTRQVVASGRHTCAIDDTGVHCWGVNDQGQTDVPALTDPVQVVVGAKHSCALDANGVTCWGSNTHGQLNVPSLVNPVQITAGAYHNCALDANGVTCWGANDQGQINVPILQSPVQVAAGVSHTCARDATGVMCWGSNAYVSRPERL